MGRIVGRYNQFKRAVDNVRNGSWTVEEFGEFLNNIYEDLGAKAQEMREIIVEEKYEEINGEEVSMGGSGIDLYDAGMQEMSYFLEDGEEHHLDEGLAMIWEGNEKINEAMRLNREGRDNLDVAFLM